MENGACNSVGGAHFGGVFLYVENKHVFTASPMTLPQQALFPSLIWTGSSRRLGCSAGRAPGNARGRSAGRPPRAARVLWSHVEREVGGAPQGQLVGGWGAFPRGRGAAPIPGPQGGQAPARQAGPTEPGRGGPGPGSSCFALRGDAGSWGPPPVFPPPQETACPQQKGPLSLSDRLPPQRKRTSGRDCIWGEAGSLGCKPTTGPECPRGHRVGQ